MSEFSKLLIIIASFFIVLGALIADTRTKAENCLRQLKSLNEKLSKGAAKE